MRQKFPERILHCNKVLESPPFLCADLDTVHSDLGIPVPDPVALKSVNHEYLKHLHAAAVSQL